MTVNATKKEASKKKLIRVEGRKGDSGGNGGYRYSSINFAFVSSPQDGRRQATSTMTCREYVNRAVWAAANYTAVSNHNPEIDAPIDFSRLRLLVVHDPAGVDVFKQKLFNGKAALNLLEKFNGWKASTITTVKHTHYDNAWLLTGPKEWMDHPQMLSLATWVLRLAARSGPLATKDFDTYENELKNMAKAMKDGADSGEYCRSFWDKIYILMKYHKDIFGKMDHEDAWVKAETPHFGVYSGLLSFINGNASYSAKIKEARKIFNKLCGQHLPRKRGK